MMTGNGEIIFNTLVVSMKFYGPSFPTFRHLTFWPETFRHRFSSPGYISICVFWPCRWSSTWTFHLHGCFSIRSFRHRDKKIFWHHGHGPWTHGHFGTWAFWHMDILAHGHFGTWTFRHSSTGAEISVLKCPYCFERCQNIHVLKCLGVKISHVQCPWYVLRIPCVKNVHVPKCLQGRNMHLPKYPGDEMSMLKWWEV